MDLKIYFMNAIAHLNKTNLSCFAGCLSILFFSPSAFAYQLQSYVMRVQLTPAVCMFDAQKDKKRKCVEGYSLNIAGLYPEIAIKDCRTTSSANLSPLQSRVVARVMPNESTRTRLWQTVGGCFPLTASQYFRKMINLADQVKIPTGLSTPDTHQVLLSDIGTQFLRLNPKLSKNSLRFMCQSQKGKTYLTGINICYNMANHYKSCSKHVVNNCPALFFIKGSY